MPNAVMKKTALNSISLDPRSITMDKVIEAMESRKGAEPPRGPRPEPSAANHTAIGVLKLTIERTQANISLARESVRSARQTLQDAEQLKSRLIDQEVKEVASLALIAKAAGMSDAEIQVIMHELNQDCEEPSCASCAHKYGDKL